MKNFHPEEFRLPPTVLLVEGMKFNEYFGPDKGEEAKKAAAICGGVVKPYGIKINVIDPKTGAVTEWEKVEGFSVWIKPEDTNSRR